VLSHSTTDYLGNDNGNAPEQSPEVSSQAQWMIEYLVLGFTTWASLVYDIGVFLEFKPCPQNSYLSVGLEENKQYCHLLGVGSMMEFGSIINRF